MVRNRRRRPTGARRATYAAVALMLGGGGLVAANVYASASEGWGDDSASGAQGQVLSTGMATIYCPDVGSRLTAVPDQVRPDVDRELAALDQQTAAAYKRLQTYGQTSGQASAQANAQASQAGGWDAGAVGDEILSPLNEKRAATVDRIADAIARVGKRPQGLEDLAKCGLRPGTGGGGQSSGGPTATPGDGAQQGGAGQAPGGAGQGGNGPVVSDYADITSVQPEATNPPQQAGASRGTFTSDCGVNAKGLFNSDNVIVAPGVTNGAHHFHDYVGNQSNNAFASDDDLAKADTSCVDQGDKSTYYWPVLRLQNGTRERDAGAPGGGTEGNAGQIVTPKQVTLTFVGNPREKVTAMPRLLRIITGDAKAFVNGPGNANASWSCTGFEDRQLKDKYPLCPQGSDVVRTFRFQSCWDGRNIDSANHRTHVAFAGADGSCAAGFRPIPQLVQRIVYDVKAPSVQDGGRTVPLFAVDSFPEQLHKPVTDHGDFINVFDEGLMREMVDCINSGRTCGPGGANGDGKGEGSGGGKGNGGGDGSTTTAAPTRSSDPGGSAEPTAGSGTAEPPRTDPTTAPATEPQTTPRTDSTTEPPADPTTRPAHTTKRDEGGQAVPVKSAGAETSSESDGGSGSGSGSGSTPAGSAAPDRPAATPPAPTTSASAPAGYVPPASTQPRTQPQAVRGGLAETGAHLWPAAIGTLLAMSGLLMLLRARRLRY